MKFIPLNQVIQTYDYDGPIEESIQTKQINLNRDMIKKVEYLPIGRYGLAKTRVTLVGPDYESKVDKLKSETIDVMETPDQIEAMTIDIINVRLIRGAQ